MATALKTGRVRAGLLEASAQLVDDSDGGLRAALDRAEEVHLAACEAGEPDPVALAELLVQRAHDEGLRSHVL